MHGLSGFYEEMHRRTRGTDAPFYLHAKGEHTYKDLERSIQLFNTYLSELKKARVLIFSEKGFETYSAVFATVLSGNCWIPINPNTPAQRAADIVMLAEPDLILTDRTLPADMAANAKCIGTDVVLISDILSRTKGIPLPPPDLNASDLAMIYFTSGSTGLPKGVMISQENFVANVRNILSLVALEEGDRFVDCHDLAFVISIPVLFPCLMVGGALVPCIQPQEQFMPLPNIIKHRVNVLITVPSTLARVQKQELTQKGLKNLKVVISCGEPMHLDVLAYVLDGMKVPSVYNFYGSTEVAPWTFHHVCRPADIDTYKRFNYVPIGKPIAGNKILLDEESELLVSGVQVTPGYLGGIGTDKFVHRDGIRWYRTGDKVIFEDGVYFCKGRLDSQIKIGGYRIELLDVESHLRTLSGTDAALCFAEGEGTVKRIVAILIGQQEYSLLAVRNHLKDRLSPYMMPRRVHCIPIAPLNKSGKIDRTSLIKKFKLVAK